MGFRWASAGDSAWPRDRTFRHGQMDRWTGAPFPGGALKHGMCCCTQGGECKAHRALDQSVMSAPHPAHPAVQQCRSPVLAHGAVLRRHSAWARNTPDCSGLGSRPVSAAYWHGTDTSWAGNVRGSPHHPLWRSIRVPSWLRSLKQTSTAATVAIFGVGNNLSSFNLARGIAYCSG